MESRDENSLEEDRRIKNCAKFSFVRYSRETNLLVYLSLGYRNIYVRWHCVEEIIDHLCSDVNSCRESEIKAGKFALQQCVTTSVPIIRRMYLPTSRKEMVSSWSSAVVFNHS